MSRSSIHAGASGSRPPAGARTVTSNSIESRRVVFGHIETGSCEIGSVGRTGDLVVHDADLVVDFEFGQCQRCEAIVRVSRFAFGPPLESFLVEAVRDPEPGLPECIQFVLKLYRPDFGRSK